MLLAVSQHIIYQRRKELLGRLCEEIVDYARLKTAWGYGHLEIKKRKCYLTVCKRLYRRFMPNHMDIYGHYVSLHNELKKLSLGCSVKDALNKVDEKKSFLFSADV